MSSKSPLVDEVVAMLKGRGWRVNGHTPSETVRIPTMRAPVFGGIGGEVRTFGGRIRLEKGDRRVTVGPRTTCFYRMDGRNAVEFDNVKTKDDDAIFARS